MTRVTSEAVPLRPWASSLSPQPSLCKPWAATWSHAGGATHGRVGKLSKPIPFFSYPNPRFWYVSKESILQVDPSASGDSVLI